MPGCNDSKTADLIDLLCHDFDFKLNKFSTKAFKILLQFPKSFDHEKRSFQIIKQSVETLSYPLEVFVKKFEVQTSIFPFLTIKLAYRRFDFEI